MHVGDRFRLAATDLEVVFVSVDGDSRCPTDVVCIQAGEARVVLARTSQPGGTLSLPVPPQGSAEATLGAWTVTALGLEPQALSTRTLTQRDYEVTLVLSAASGDRSIPVEVMFSRRPESDMDPSAVFPVDRVAHDITVARFVVNELLAGPTVLEQEDGYFSAWSLFDYASDSDCGGRFEIAVEEGIAAVRFCVTVVSPGVVADGQALSSMSATLEQFPTVNRVRVLDRAGHCLFDLSGLDRCLDP
jgi:hypothetical protein